MTSPHSQHESARAILWMHCFSSSHPATPATILNVFTTVPMGLYAFLTNIWTGFRATQPKSKRRRGASIADKHSIKATNHWYPGDRPLKKPRRLVETPTPSHWPTHRVESKKIAKGRKRCMGCGALLKESGSASRRKQNRNGNGTGDTRENLGTRMLRGRVVKYTV